MQASFTILPRNPWRFATILTLPFPWSVRVMYPWIPRALKRAIAVLLTRGDPMKSHEHN